MFWNNFYALCKEKKKTPTEVVEELGIARGSITKWKNGTLPSKKNLSKIAEYFGVSVGTLFDEPDQKEKPYAKNAEDYTDIEKQMIEAFRANPNMQAAVLRLLGITAPSPDLSPIAKDLASTLSATPLPASKK